MEDWQRGAECIVERSPFFLLIALRLRAADLLRRSLTIKDFPDLRDELDALTALWTTSLAREGRGHPIVEGVKDYLECVIRERPLLHALLTRIVSTRIGATFHPLSYPRLYHGATCSVDELLRLLAVLNSPEDYLYVDAESLCQSTGLFLDRWEELLFKTSLFNFDDFLVSWSPLNVPQGSDATR